MTTINPGNTEKGEVAINNISREKKIMLTMRTEPRKHEVGTPASKLSSQSICAI